MSSTEKVTINGSGSSSGGECQSVKIRGEGTITSDVQSSVIKTYGSSEFKGNVTTKQFDVLGETEVSGELIADSLKVIGTLSVDSFAKINKLKIRGTGDFENRLISENADVKGTISVKGDLEVETITINGGIEVDGLLNAGTVEVGLRFGDSRIDEIGGAKITIKHKKGFFLFGNKEGMLYANVIEGDNVFIENTKAEVVRGKNVHIGAGCEIEQVEYSGEYKQASHARVKKHTKI